MYEKKIDECLESIEAGAGEEYLKLALDNVNPSVRLAEAVKPASRAVAAIGSERGWTERERHYTF
jgi:16S rRNA U1498 N3-methylase RsmE